VTIPRNGEQTSGIRALWIPAEEVSALLHVHRSTIWRWLDQALIPPPGRIGGRTLWLRADIELFARCTSLSEFRKQKARRHVDIET
jgi:predicted DNA-binding transcriptional regulator AlpA